MKSEKRSRWPVLTAIAALAVMLVGSGYRLSIVSADDSESQVQFKKQREKILQKEFLRAHSDETGKPRPDLWQKGVEQQKHMQVAPYIGWHPPASSAKKSAATSKDSANNN